MQKIIGVLFVLLFVFAFVSASWAEVTRGSMTAENDWMLLVVRAVIVVGVLAVSLVHQRSGKSEWWLFGFYGLLLVMVGGTFIDNNNIIAAICFAIGAIIAFVIAIAIAFDSASAITGIAIAGIAGAFEIAIAHNQRVEYAVFMACVILASYPLAKLAKRLGWIKVAEKPATWV